MSKSNDDQTRVIEREVGHLAILCGVALGSLAAGLYQLFLSKKSFEAKTIKGKIYLIKSARQNTFGQAQGVFKSEGSKVYYSSDIVEEASIESFPASDPPAWMITQVK